MNKEKRRALEAAGWVFGSAEDFLELTAEERAILEVRVKLSRAIRELREKHKLTQADLAKKIKTSQPRVNRIESGGSGVSIEQLMSSYFALGGSVRVELIPYPDADIGTSMVSRGRANRSDDSLVGLGGARPGKTKKYATPKKATKAK
jgi:transcriptional regulator with XRE-family HTH domain